MRVVRPPPREALEVPCTVDIEDSHDSVHAHVELEGAAVAPGDSVRVHGAPTDPGPARRLRCRRRATLTRAGALRRAWTRIAGLFELTELYDIPFSARRKP